MKITPLIREAFENAAQTLAHGGLHTDMAATLLGVSTATFRELVAGGEKRTPRLCSLRCTDILGPCCPYCDRILTIAKFGGTP